MASTFQELLDELEDILRVKFPACHASLAPGVSAELLDHLEKTLGVTLNDHFCQLYQWHNGQSSTAGVGVNQECPFWNGWWFGLDGVVHQWNEFNRFVREGWLDDMEPPFDNVTNWWNPQWLPILDDGSGDFLCVDTAGSFGGNKYQLVRYVHDDTVRFIDYDSIENWLRITCNVLSDDRMYEDGEFEFDNPVLIIEHSAALMPDYRWHFPPYPAQGFLALLAENQDMAP